MVHPSVEFYPMLSLFPPPFQVVFYFALIWYIKRA